MPAPKHPIELAVRIGRVPGSNLWHTEEIEFRGDRVLSRKSLCGAGHKSKALAVLDQHMGRLFIKNEGLSPRNDIPHQFTPQEETE